MADQEKRAAIVAEARRWVGTPYHHQSAQLGIGCDCLGLVRAVYEALLGAPTETPPSYTPDWAVSGTREVLLEAAARHLDPLDSSNNFDAGDVLAFRYRPNWLARHLAIATSRKTMIHAINGIGVIEIDINRWWRRRLVAAFSFPTTKTGNS